MQETLVFIDSVTGFGSFNFESIKTAKIFSFNIHAHKFLEEKKIKHSIAENHLQNGDHEKIFDYAIGLWNWYDNSTLNKEFEFENLNLLSVADTSEFHQIIIREIFNFFAIKRVIEKEKPQKIVLSAYFAKIVKQIDNKISLEIVDQEHEFHIQWEKMLIRFTVLNHPVSIPISRKRYNQFKKIFELVVGNTLGLWLSFANKKPSILFLEFNPAQYPSLLDNLKNFKGNIVFFNRRRPAAWNLQSIKLLKKYRIKLISSDLSLSGRDKEKIDKSIVPFSDKLKKLWLDDSVLPKIFTIEQTNFWPVISDVLYETYRSRLIEYMQLILTCKKIFSLLNVKCIISLNILGETEKVTLAVNNYQIPSILLEHGATNYVSSISKYDISNMYPIFRDKIVLWGEIQKSYLLQYRKIDPDRILTVGSPRHEDFFKKTKSEKINSAKTILITPQAMSEFNGLVDTNSYLRLEKLLTKIFQAIDKIPDVKILVKMHPTLAPGNEYVKELIHKLHPSAKILQLEPISEVIDSCDAMININTEFFPSTVLYEGMIMKKPIMNIMMMDEKYDFEFIKDKAVITVSDHDDLDESLTQLLDNSDYRMHLVDNGQKHLKRYFNNQTTASEKLADILLSYSN